MDVNTNAQLSSIFRYFEELDVKERYITLIGFSENTTEKGIFNAIKSLKENFLFKEKLVGQTFDGAPVMSGNKNYVKMLLKEEYEAVESFYCNAHAFNLYLKNFIVKSETLKNFFENIESIGIFLKKSTENKKILEKHTVLNIPRTIKIRCNYHSRIINRIFEIKKSLSIVLMKLKKFKRLNWTLDFKQITLQIFWQIKQIYYF